jgi:hypothetical protein
MPIKMPGPENTTLELKSDELKAKGLVAQEKEEKAEDFADKIKKAESKDIKRAIDLFNKN